MSIAELDFTARVLPLVELGLGNTPVNMGTALWDTAVWDFDTWVGPDASTTLTGQWGVARWDSPAGSPQSEWSGVEPAFYDITCYVHSLEWGLGRARTTDRFEVGFCSVTLDNQDGRFDPQLPAPPGAQLQLIPGRAVRVGVQHQTRGTVWLWRGYIDEIVPQYLPEAHDTLVVNAVDAVGEVNRSDIVKFDPPVGAGETATARVRRILNLAGWPSGLSALDPAGTLMLATEMGAPAADLLSVTTESEGGAVYGDRRGRVAFRQRDWQTYDAQEPVQATVGNVGADDVCPTELETSFRRQDIVTRAVVARETDTTPRVYEDVEGITLYGQETWEATDLVCSDVGQLSILGHRQLRVRSHENMPRVEAVSFDAATGDDVVDLLCAADPMLPSRWRVRLNQDRGTVFDSQMFVTGIRHVLEPHSWTARVDLDLAWPFAVPNEYRWSDPAAKWGHAQWSKAV